MFKNLFRKQTEKEEVSFILKRLKILMENHEFGNDTWFDYHNSVEWLKKVEDKI